MSEPNWKDYTSIFEAHNRGLNEFKDKHGYYPNLVELTVDVWEKVNKNHFITIPNTNLFFGIPVKVGTSYRYLHTDVEQYET